MSKIEEIPEIETAELISKTVPPTRVKINRPRCWRERGIECEK